jgi:hypothetical protein
MPEQQTVDFEELLNFEAANAVKPPPMPNGTYRVLVDANEMVKSQNKGTPGVMFTLTGFEPQASVDVDKWQEYLASPAIDPNKISRQETFYLTPKAMWRLKDFCVKAGAKDTGPMKQLIADAMKQTILVEIEQSVSQDGETVYNNVRSYAAVE